MGGPRQSKAAGASWRLRDFDKTMEIPYWNWTTCRKIPKHMKKKLFGWMHVPRSVTHNGDRLPTVNQLHQVANAATFTDFDLGSGLKSGKGLIILHGEVHNWVGGNMANPKKSPNDPIFFLHHAFIDKVWADWQGTHHPSLFPEEYRDSQMKPWSVTVDDVLTTK